MKKWEKKKPLNVSFYANQTPIEYQPHFNLQALQSETTSLYMIDVNV